MQAVDVLPALGATRAGSGAECERVGEQWGLAGPVEAKGGFRRQQSPGTASVTHTQSRGQGDSLGVGLAVTLG